MKKVLFLFMGVMMAVFTTYAYDFKADAPIHDSYGQVSEYVTLYYAINPDETTVSVTKGPNPYSAANVEIPDQVEDETGKRYTVTAIGYSAFTDALTQTVKLPDSVTEIQNEAFYNARHLNSITLSKNLKKIGDHAFNADSRMPMSHIDFPDGLEYIGYGAFSFCSLTDLDIPDSVTFIDESAFSSNKIVSLKLPRHLKELCDNTFAHNYGLKKVVFPDDLEIIGNEVFADCPLEEFTLPSTLRIIGKENFGSMNRESFTFPPSVTEIGSGLFWGNKVLEKIEFGSGLTTIPDFTCSGCSNLIKVIIPDNITVIGNGAFAECTSLSSISLPDYIETLVGTFSYCTSLTRVTLPKNLKTLGNGTFRYCKMLKTVVLPETLESIGEDCFSECTGLEELHIPYSVTSFYSYAFINTTGNVHVARAVPPAVNKTRNGGGGYLAAYNAALFVPRGAADAYIADTGWDFASVTEEDVIAPEFMVSADVTAGYGSIDVNGIRLAYPDYSTKIEYGKDIDVKFIPDDKYELNRVILNGKDITGDIIENTYSIHSADTNYKFETSFSLKPIDLHIATDESGSVCLKYQSGSSVTVTITPADGWRIYKSYLWSGDSNTDITGEIGMDGKYTTPTLTDESWLNVVFVKEGDAGITVNNINAIRLLSTAPGELCVTGAEGLSVTVYDIGGCVVAACESASTSETFSLIPNAAYIVRVGEMTFKTVVR